MDPDSLLTPDDCSIFFLEGVPYVTWAERQSELQSWFEVFPGVWIVFSRRKISDEDLIEAVPDEWHFHMFRAMEERTRSTCSGFVCQLVIRPRETERFMLEEGHWDEPKLVTEPELKMIFMSYCISMDASDRMRIIGECNIMWDLIGTEGPEQSMCKPVGEFNRDSNLLGDEMPESIDPDWHPDIKFRTWIAAKIILDKMDEDRFLLFLRYYHMLIDSENTSLRFQYAITGLEALMPSKTDIRKSLLRRASILATPSDEVGNDEHISLSEMKERVGELLTICNKVKHNQQFNDKEEEIHDQWVKSIPVLFKLIFNRIVDLGGVPSVTEIDLADESGFVSEPIDFTSIFSYDQYFNSLYRHDCVANTERVQRWKDLGGAEKMLYDEFAFEEARKTPNYGPLSTLKIPRRSIIGALISTLRRLFYRVKKGFESQDEADTDNERPMFRQWQMLLGVPMVKDQDGNQLRWLEIFPGMHIHWSDNIYEDGEIKSRCEDNLAFHQIKIMEIFSRESNSGWICELEIDYEDTVDFLESNGMGHLSPNIDNLVQEDIFRIFTTLCTPFNGTRVMSLYNRFWPILLDDDFWVGEIGADAMWVREGKWTILLEGLEEVWPGVEHNTITLDLWEQWKPIVWRSALMIIEGMEENDRLFKSARDPLSSFLFSRDRFEKNASFIQILTTLLRPSRSGPGLPQLVSAIAVRKDDENKETKEEHIANLVTDSVKCRNDFFHGRFVDDDILHSITPEQHVVINLVYQTIALHGGIPDDDLIAEAIEGAKIDYKRGGVLNRKYGLSDSRDDEISRYNSKYGSGPLAWYVEPLPDID